jgi:alpha-tubulin suppressor-like RCC1 family protein
VINTFQTAPSRTPVINAIDISALEQGVLALVDTSVRPVNVQGSLEGKISVGNSHACAIIEDGTAWCWGNDTNGQLGNGATTGDQVSPTRVSDPGPWMQIGAAYNHSCGLKTDGSVWCWGRDNSGQLGTGGGSVGQTSPVAVTSTLPWSKISIRGNISCGIKVDGSAWCWGYGANGAIGNGSNGNADVPTQVSGGYLWTDIGADDEQVVGIQKDGSLWFWGTNTAGALYTNLYPTGSTVPVKALDPGPWIKVFRKGAGVACALKADGSLWCWGDQNLGTVGNGVATATTISIPTRVIDAGPWVDFSSGANGASCGRKIDGSLWCWGVATNGVLGNGLTAGAFPYPVPVNAGNDWVAISTGNSRSCAMKQDKSIWCWGTDTNGALGNGANVTAVQSRPYRVATLPIRNPWSISADGGGVNMRPNLIANIGTTRSLSADGAANSGLNLSGSGRSVLRSPTAGNQLLISATGNQLASQLSFKAPSAPSTNILPSNPVAWYKMEETSGTTVVDSIGGNNGTWTGTPAIASAAGRVGNAVDIPADTTYIVLGSPAALTNLYPVTVSAWINPDTVNCHTGFTNLCNIIYTTDNDSGPAGGWGFYMNPSRNIAVDLDGDGLQTVTTQTIPLGTWTHVAVSWAPPAAAKVYINGVEASYSVSSGMPWLDDTGTNKNIGGADSPSQTWNMDGKIDEVLIYGRILTPAEIAQIYNAPASTTALIRTLGLDPLTGNFKFARNALGVDAWLNDLYADLEIGKTGEVGIGTSGAPQAKLDVKGAIQIGNDASACASGLAGTMRWNGTAIEYCNGSAWGTLYAGAIPWGTGKDQFSAPCAIRSDGTAWCWGNGALGNGTALGTVSTTPVQVQTNTGPGGWNDWIKISADACHTCGIRTNGTLWCWGNAQEGQLGNGDWSTNQSRPVQVQTDTGPGGWSDWVEVSAGSGWGCYARTCGRRADGSAWCWGSTTGDGTDAARARPIRIQTDTGPGAWSDWTKITSDSDLSCGLRSNGTAWCWGNNYNGSVGDGSPTSTIRYRPSQVVAENPIDPPYTDWVDISAMGYKICGKRASGSIWCWGHDGSGQLGRGWTVADETRPSIVVDDTSGPAGWTDWASLGVGASTNHVGCGVRANGTAWCWGGDYNGQMGNGTGGGSGAPMQVVTDTGTGGWNDWVTISFVNDTTCGVRVNGSLWCWGAGAYGFIGNGGTTDQQQPVRVKGSP